MDDNNIKTLLYKLKANTSLVEQNNYSTDILDELKNDCVSLLELLKLFLISNRDTYYGYFVMNMIYEIDFKIDQVAGIKLNTYPPTFITNPLLLSQFNLNEILYIMCHEIDHIVLNHPAEMVKLNPENDERTFYEFNLAADASVNDRINHEIIREKRKFLKSPKGLITSDSLKEMFNLKHINNLESYLYYFNLIHTKKSVEEVFEMMPVPASGDGGDSDANDASSNQGEPNSEGENLITKNNFTNKDDHSWGENLDSDEVSDIIKEFVNTVISSMNEESRGLMPGYFISSIEKINEPPKITWQSLLKKYIGTVSANKRFTRTRLNRRQPERFDLSGKIDDKVLKIVIAIDTSGSMYDYLLARVFKEVFAIISKRKHDITVIECDTKIRKVYKVKNPSDVNTTLEGRGGTCFQPVIDYINDNKYFRDALLIYFTDGFGEDEITKPKTYRNLWVIIGDKDNLSLKEPYGNAIDFEVDYE